MIMQLGLFNERWFKKRINLLEKRGVQFFLKKNLTKKTKMNLKIYI